MTTKLLAREEPAIYKVLVQPDMPVVRLGQLLTVVRGVTYKKETARSAPAEGLVALLRATNIQQSLSFDELVYVPANCVSETQLLRAGDILVVASSGSRTVVGKAAPLTRSWKGSFGAFCFALRPNAGVDPNYIAAFLRSPQYRDRASALSAGTNINNLRASHIEETPIPLPTVDRQREIVAYLGEQLSRLDASVAALHRVQANLKRYRASVLKSACEGRLVPTEAELARQQGRDFETGAQLLQCILAERLATAVGKQRESVVTDAGSLPRLPEGWTWSSLGQIGMVASGLTKNPKREKLEPKLPYLRVANVYADELRLSEIEFIGVGDAELEKLLVFKDDLLVVEGNGSPDQIGRVALWDGSISPCVHQNHLIKVRLHTVNARWAMNWLLSPAGRTQIERVSSSTSGLHTLSTGKVARLSVPLPPLAEQHRIVAEADRRLSLIRVAEAQVTANLARAQRLRQSILQAAFAGPG